MGIHGVRGARWTLLAVCLCLIGDVTSSISHAAPIKALSSEEAQLQLSKPSSLLGETIVSVATEQSWDVTITSHVPASQVGSQTAAAAAAGTVTQKSYTVSLRSHASFDAVLTGDVQPNGDPSQPPLELEMRYTDSIAHPYVGAIHKLLVAEAASGDMSAGSSAFELDPNRPAHVMNSVAGWTATGGVFVTTASGANVAASYVCLLSNRVTLLCSVVADQERGSASAASGSGDHRHSWTLSAHGAYVPASPSWWQRYSLPVVLTVTMMLVNIFKTHMEQKQSAKASAAKRQ